jgi:PilZ domain
MQKPSDPPDTASNWFNRHAPAPFKVNQRKGIRFIRNDIGVSLRTIGLFNFSKQDISVKLLDISSRGIFIETDINLPINKKVFLTIRFADFKEFGIPSKVVRKSAAAVTVYGIKFDRLNDALADKLLSTQRKLAFK